MVALVRHPRGPDGAAHRTLARSQVGWNRSTSPQGMLAEALGEDAATSAGGRGGEPPQTPDQPVFRHSQEGIRGRGSPRWPRIERKPRGICKRGRKSLAKGGIQLTGWLAAERLTFFSGVRVEAAIMEGEPAQFTPSLAELTLSLLFCHLAD